MSFPIGVLVGRAPGRRAPARAAGAEAELFLRALERRQRGETEAARADAELLARRAPGAPEAQGLLGLFQLEAGQVAAARAAFDRSVAAAPDAGWPRALRSLALSAADDWAGALAELDRAAAAYPSPWVLSRRALVLDRVGRFEEALRVLGRVGRMMPGSPEPGLLAARIHQDQAQYARAALRLDRALRLRPGDAALYVRRAKLRLLEGKLAPAARDLDAALRRAPADPDARYERVLVALLLGDPEGAAAALRSGRALGPARHALLSGILASRRRKYAEAARLFTVASSDPSLRERALHYRLVCRILSTPPSSVRSVGSVATSLTLCGLGYRHPFQVSVEVVRALASADVFYCNLSDPKVTEFLALFPAELRAVVFRKWRSQAETCSRQVFAGLSATRRGGQGVRVCFVTRGHPVFYGDLASKMALRARREGVPCRILASVSIADTLTSLCGSGADGLRIVDGSRVRDGAPRGFARRPAVVYSVGDGRSRELFAAALAKALPAERGVWLLAGSGELEYEPKRFAARDAAGALASADSAVTLFVEGP